MLSTYVIHDWPMTRAEVREEVKLYWSFRDKVVVINGIMMKGRRILIPALLQKRALEPLYANHIDIKKTRLYKHMNTFIGYILMPI